LSFDLDERYREPAVLPWDLDAGQVIPSETGRLLHFMLSILPTARASLVVGLRRASLHDEQQDRYLEKPMRWVHLHPSGINLEAPIAAEARRCNS